MKRGEFAEPLALLQACHCRIEEQLTTLERLAGHAADATAATTVLRYFDTSGAMHHRDEDEDLFPLLRKRAAALGRVEVAAGIDELEREHATMDAQWRRLRKQLNAMATLDRDDVARFAWLYRRHMERESLLVLPFAAEVLTADERAGLGERMAARRSETGPIRNR